ncbi:MAG: replication protein [Candidatus Thiodiazotropha endolucinida]|nr:replication protein [Candidatus Thiodiazotropha endolucinida]
MNQQLDLFEASHYHDPGRWGYFSILFKDLIDGKPAVRQESFPLHQMHEVIPFLGFPERRDYWISQADFARRNRRAVNMAAIGVLFVDLDYYKLQRLQHMDPHLVAHLVLDRCQELGWPEPSLMIDSGRGMQLKWFHEPLPRAALPRWHAVEDALVAAFADLGADPQVRDVSRVLRLVNSTNQKNKRRVEIVHVAWGDGDQAKKHAFDDMASITLPFTRESAAKFKQERASSSKKAQLELIQGGKRNIEGLLPFNPKKLAWDRLADIRVLAQLRFGGEVPEDSKQRDEFLFWACNFAALNLWGRTHKFWHEAYQLAAELTPSLPRHEVTGSLSTVWDKMQQMARGEWIEFNGRKYPPLYTPRNSTLIQRMSITLDEQRQLGTIISKELARERDAARKRTYRADKGAMSRDAYEQRSQDRRDEALALRAQGLKQREIAESMGITQAWVSKLLRKKNI